MRRHGSSQRASGTTILLAAVVSACGALAQDGRLAPSSQPQAVVEPLASGNGETPPAGDATQHAALPAYEIPDVEYDPAGLPPPVRRLRDEIIAAAATGDVEALRPIVEAQAIPPTFGFDPTVDPIEHLKSLSGDDGGREILAVLIEVFEAGYVHVEEGTDEEAYVWPYFARYPVDALTPPQLVELFKLVYPGDYEDMKTFGHYMAFRAAIAPDGSWLYFLVGD